MTAGYRRETDGSGRTRRIRQTGRSTEETGKERMGTREEKLFFALGAAAIGLTLSLALFGAPGPQTAEEKPSTEVPAGAVAVMTYTDGTAGDGERGEDPEVERRAGPDSAPAAAAEDGERSVYDEIGRFFARFFPGG